MLYLTATVKSQRKPSVLQFVTRVTHPPAVYVSSTVFLSGHQWHVILTEDCKEVAPDPLSLHIHKLYTLILRMSIVLILKKACSYRKMSFKMLVYIMDRQVQYYMSWGNNKLILPVYNGIILSYCSFMIKLKYLKIYNHV